MDLITQEQALAETPLKAGERAHLFAARRFDGLEFLAATFRTHAYAPHAHDTYAIGTILTGCEVWHARGRRLYAGPGDLVLLAIEGYCAMTAVGRPDSPIDAAVIGVIDRVDLV